MIILLFIILLTVPLYYEHHFILEWNFVFIAASCLAVFKLPNPIRMLIGPLIIGAAVYLNISAIHPQWVGAQVFLSRSRFGMSVCIMLAVAVLGLKLDTKSIRKGLGYLFYLLAIAVAITKLSIQPHSVSVHNLPILASLCALTYMFTRRRILEILIMWAAIFYVKSTTPIIVGLFIQCYAHGLYNKKLISISLIPIGFITYMVVPEFTGGLDRWVHYSLYLQRWWDGIIRIYVENGNIVTITNRNPWGVNLFGWGGATFGYWGPLQEKSIGLVNWWYLWAHSDWLQIMLEYGIVGLSIFLGLYLRILYYVKFDTQVFGFLFGFGLLMVTYFPLHNPFCFVTLLLVLKTIKCNTILIQTKNVTRLSALGSLNRILSTT